MATPTNTTTIPPDFSKNLLHTNAQVKEYINNLARLRAGQMQFSSAVGGSSISLDNFGNLAVGAAKKVMIWQFAIGAVYGVLRKVTQVVDDWKKLEVTLVRIGITTGATTTQLQKYFKEAANVAIQFGMPLEQTLTGMDLALRATADLGKTAQRTATAVTLLKDASVLANVTGMQYTQSLDLLVSTLRQLNIPLDQGSKLLDKWVAVQKTAQVSVNDLSQSFSIMAEAGRSAGLSIDQMNGLIAGLSMYTSKSATEVGNSMRAIMSTLYNESSIKQLQKYGVAVRDVNGDVRSFWDIMNQLSAMQITGVLSEAQWLEIAKAAGAGQRRYADFLQTLKAMPIANQAMQASTRANGDAMDANARIVGALTNKWDSFVAAQKQMFFNMGTGTGSIQGLSKVMESLTSVFTRIASAGDGVWNMVKAITALVATLGALKLASAAMGWMKAGPRLGSLLGGMTGMPSAAIAGSSASFQNLAALQGMSEQANTLARIAALEAQILGTDEAQVAAVQAKNAAMNAELASLKAQAGLSSIGTISPATAMRTGLGSMVGLLPGGTNRALANGYAVPAGGKGAAGYLYGMGQYGPGYFKGTPPVNVPMAMTWGRVGQGLSGIGRALTTPVSGMTRGIGALGAGAAAYGMTGEWQTAVGSGIGTAIGGAFGPLGMALGAGIGGVIGHLAADTFVSQSDKIKSVFKKGAEEFGLDVGVLMKKYFKEAAAAGGEEMQKYYSAASAPKFAEETAKSEMPFWKRLIMGGLALGSPVSPANKYSFNAPWVKQPGETEWTKGLGALPELNEALVNGVISVDEYRKAKQKDHIAWEVLSDDAKNYIDLSRRVQVSEGGAKIAYEIEKAAIEDTVKQRREATKVDNQYMVDQQRIKAIMEGVGAVISGTSLKQWEATQIAKLLASGTKMTREELDNLRNSLTGIAYGYSSYLALTEKVNSIVGSLGISINTIPLDKWQLIQRFDPDFATKVVEANQSIVDLTKSIKQFENVDFKDILSLSGTKGTLDNLDAIQTALEGLGTQEAQDAISKIQDYIQNKGNLGVAQSQAQMNAAFGARFQRPTDLRLYNSDQYQDYLKKLPQLGAYTKLAEGLGKYDTTTVTLIDVNTKQIKTLEDVNSAALQMIDSLDQNTKSNQLEATYNMPSWYSQPSRYWALKTTGTTNFGPAQSDMWQLWMEYLQKNKGYASGGVIPETGPYYLHKKEVVVNGNDITGTNSILSNSLQTLMVSQQYLGQINLGIQGLRDELAGLKNALLSGGKKEGGDTEFKITTRSGYIGMSSLGTRRM